jgi:hypothetical protein
MSENLLLPGFEPMESNGSTPSAAGSRAKTSRWLERVQVLPESAADYGESSPVWLANFDPVTSSWRTSGLFAVEDSPQFSETLPRSGMTRSGTLFLLPPLVRLIYASGSGSSRLLPTPLHSDADRPRRSPGSIALGGGPKLMDVLLPTPTASDYSSNQGGAAGRVGPVRYSLDGMAKRGMIPTPTAGDAKQSGSRNTSTSKAHPGLSLNDWARGDGGTGRLLPTPQAQDHRNCAAYSDGSRGHSPQLRRLGSGRLNPRFVEWMMDYEPGWTDLDELDTPS